MIITVIMISPHLVISVLIVCVCVCFLEGLAGVQLLHLSNHTGLLPSQRLSMQTGHLFACFPSQTSKQAVEFTGAPLALFISLRNWFSQSLAPVGGYGGRRLGGANVITSRGRRGLCLIAVGDASPLPQILKRAVSNHGDAETRPFRRLYGPPACSAIRPREAPSCAPSNYHSEQPRRLRAQRWR